MESEQHLEHWQVAWREGLAPALPSNGLEALRRALEKDEDNLLQGTTVGRGEARLVYGGCAVAFCGWRNGKGITHADQLDFWFDAIIDKANKALARSCVPAVPRFTAADFIAWFDNSPRDVMRTQLLEEVNRELLIRKSSAPA